MSYSSLFDAKAAGAVVAAGGQSLGSETCPRCGRTTRSYEQSVVAWLNGLEDLSAQWLDVPLTPDVLVMFRGTPCGYVEVESDHSTAWGKSDDWPYLRINVPAEKWRMYWRQEYKLPVYFMKISEDGFRYFVLHPHAFLGGHIEPCRFRSTDILIDRFRLPSRVAVFDAAARQALHLWLRCQP